MSEGYPDKVADQISDALIDNFLAFDAGLKVAALHMAKLRVELETLYPVKVLILALRFKGNSNQNTTDINGHA